MSTYASVQNSPLTVRSISGRSRAETTLTRTDDGIAEAAAQINPTRSSGYCAATALHSAISNNSQQANLTARVRLDRVRVHDAHSSPCTSWEPAASGSGARKFAVLACFFAGDIPLFRCEMSRRPAPHSPVATSFCLLWPAECLHGFERSAFGFYPR